MKDPHSDSVPTRTVAPSSISPATPSSIDTHSDPAMAAPSTLTHLGEYALLGELGRGGMGVVYRAEDPRLKREIALKVMLPQFAANPQAKARFVREARAQAKVEHDHVAAIYQVAEHDGLPYLVMPLLKGMTLQAALKANPRPPLNEVIRIGREVAEGLAAAHEKGLVHRDIKPANIWLEGKKLRVKVLDFGLARIVSDADAEGSDGPVTREGAVVGTPGYMSPEQGRGLPVDGRTDLFSLGVMLYQMTTGELPFRGATMLAILTSLGIDNPPPPIVVNPAVPQALSDIVMRLLAKDPAYRPPTAEIAVEELRGIEAGLVNAVRVIALDSPPPIILSNAGPDPFADLDATEVNSTPEATAVEEPEAVDEPAKSRGGFPMWAIAVGVLLAVTLIVGVVVSQMSKKPADVVKEESPTLTPTPKEKPVAAGDLLVLKYGSNPAVEMKFRWIPPGKFARGNPPQDITISKGFWMAETECTQAQWRAIMKARPDPSQFKGDNLPVERVSATDADEFCKELATVTRKPMRLPSEAEWEYACRAATKTEYHSGDGEDALKKAGWYGGNAGGKTHPVGELAANLWGLRDMHGNVWEWCQDGFEADYYGKSPATDPLNTNNQTNASVFRGGSWGSDPGYCLAAYRLSDAPGIRDSSIGFRVCFTPQEPPTSSFQPKEKPLSPGDVLVLKYGNPAVEMKFRWIPPGKFTRGNPPQDITISKGFWMAETECTQAQWRAIMKARPDPSEFKGDNLPVEQVSATDADEFCKELATVTRKPMRLPSEAEWEYACRAGTKTEYYSGDGGDALKKAGWYKGNSGDKTQPVGGLAANLWGLKDMHGNVWEWCQDGFEADYYGKSPATDPLNTNQTNSSVIRGGSWGSNPDYCLAAFRGYFAPGNRDGGIGFRVCFRLDG